MVVDTTCHLVSCLDHTEATVLFNAGGLQFNDGVLQMQGREKVICAVNVLVCRGISGDAWRMCEEKAAVRGGREGGRR